MKWSLNEDDTIRNLWDRKTAQEIADLLGNGRTRNAVIGRHKRLIGRVYEVRKLLKPKVYKKPDDSNRPIEVYTAYGKPTSLLDLQENYCRFPVEGTKLFCGAKCHGTYCHHHQKICWQRPKKAA